MPSRKNLGVGAPDAVDVDARQERLTAIGFRPLALELAALATVPHDVDGYGDERGDHENRNDDPGSDAEVLRVGGCGRQQACCKEY